MRSPTRSIAATWTRWSTSLAICSYRSCSTPGWPRKPAILRSHDVLNRISDKLERRHPHIFGDADEGGHHLWEVIKAEERAKLDDKSALAGVALALPALERAAKLQKRAARTGFDWPDIEGPKAKIREELDEIAEAPPEELEEEVGDLLFAVVNFARYLKIEPEEALRKANRKFEQRFRQIEQAPGFEQMSLEEMEELWVAAKQAPAEA